MLDELEGRGLGRTRMRGDGIRALGAARGLRSFDFGGVACSCRSCCGIGSVAGSVGIRGWRGSGCGGGR